MGVSDSVIGGGGGAGKAVWRVMHRRGARSGRVDCRGAVQLRL